MKLALIVVGIAAMLALAIALSDIRARSLLDVTVNNHPTLPIPAE